MFIWILGVRLFFSGEEGVDAGTMLEQHRSQLLGTVESIMAVLTVNLCYNAIFNKLSRS